jgi:NAD+ diphosphatase
MDHGQRSALNFFTGTDLDRVTHRRRDQEWIAEQLQSLTTRVIPVWQGRNLFVDSQDGSGPVFPTAGELSELLGPITSPILLGIEDHCTFFAVDMPADDRQVPQQLSPLGRLYELKQAATMVDSRQAGLLAYANAITYWHRCTSFCGTCGSRTTSSEAGHVLVCSNQGCCRQHFPRTDPAIIVLVSHGEKCLLGRQPVWPPRLYSTIAGFVEPGETLEQAVVREVHEETGVVVTGVRYASSQPWPFPGSIMLGFYADAGSTDLRVDGDELEHARWLSRDEMQAELENRTLRLPSPFSIAHRLIEDWFNAGDNGRLSEALNRPESH